MMLGRVVRSIAVACLSSTVISVASAQSYPSKSIRVIVASSAGSNPDTVARVVADGLTQVLGQQVIVDDRAGAGGNIGAEAAARAPPDGYTVFLAHTNHSVNATLYKKLSYDVLRDFSPVTLLALSAYVASVHPSVPARSVRDLVNIAKSRPNELTYSSAGTGSGTFFAAEYFKGMAKVNMLHVAYKGGGPALSSVLSGETTVYFTPVATGLPHFRGGKLRALGVTSAKRLSELPDVPPIADTLPGYELLGWAGLMVQVKAPKDVVDTLHNAAVTALKRPDVAKRLDDLGYIPVGSRPEEMGAYVKSEIDKYAKLIAQIGLPRE
jgi:tripartite-type tricarboxylate transporter receptor subunit TctC